jgi:hypothetical protein
LKDILKSPVCGVRRRGLGSDGLVKTNGLDEKYVDVLPLSLSRDIPR